jgi:hypothetical protein
MARTTRTIRTDLPLDVWDRLDAEAAAKNIPIGRHLRNLITTRDAKRYPDASPGATSSTGTTDRK